MARRMGKLERMAVAEELLQDQEPAETFGAPFEAMAEALEELEEARREAAEALAEAQGHHEEREWEARDDSIETASDSLERMAEQLDLLEAGLTMQMVEDAKAVVANLRTASAAVREHIDQLI